MQRLRPAVEDRPFLSLFFLALIIRLSLVALSDLFEGFVLDDGTYHAMATDMASGDISNWDDFTYSLFWRTASFLGPVTLLYKLFGPEIVVGQIFVAFVGATSVVVVTRLALEFLSVRWALVVGVVLALLPSQAFWSAQLMKDASVWLALSGLALAVAIANRSTGRKLLAAGLAVGVILCALAFLREHTLVVAAWATMIASLAGIARARVARISGAIVLGITIPWVVAAIGPAGLNLVTNAGSLAEIRFKMAQGANTAVVDTTPGGPEADLNSVVLARKKVEAQIAELETDPEASEADPDQEAGEAREQRLAELRAQAAALLAKQTRLQEPAPGAQLSDEESALDPNIAHLPRGISVMLIEPLPLPFTGSPSLKLARLESLIWYPILFFGGYGLWLARSRLRALLFPILAAGGVLLMYALAEGNVGTAFRHRGEAVWAIVLLAALGLSQLSARRSRQKSGALESGKLPKAGLPI